MQRTKIHRATAGDIAQRLQAVEGALNEIADDTEDLSLVEGDAWSKVATEQTKALEYIAAALNLAALQIRAECQESEE